MDVTPLISSDRQVIQKYSADGFKISGVTRAGPVLVMPDWQKDWPVANDFTTLNIDSFTALTDRADDIDVVLLGTGASQKFFSPALKQSLKEKGLIVEAMDTGAACRTYNVLMAEGRRVAAALLPL